MHSCSVVDLPYKSPAVIHVCCGKKKKKEKGHFADKRQQERYDDRNEGETGTCCRNKWLHVPVRKIILKQYWLCDLRAEQM